MDTAGGALTRLRDALLDLAEWGSTRLNDDHDRQYIAEHLTDTILALAVDEDPPTAPF